MQAWPSFLPLPNNAYEVNITPSALRTAMDSGATRQRQRFTREQRTVRATWTFTDLECATFQGWYFHSLAGGTAWFTITLPLGNGAGVEEYIARFVADKYTSAYLPVNHWRVSATLELRDQTTISADLAGLLILLGGDAGGFVSAADLHHYAINIVSPNLD